MGRISTHGLNTLVYRVNSLKEILTTIIPHFDKYPLITQKWADFILFKDIVNLMSNKQHLTMEGLHKIVSLKKSLNLGLSDELNTAFSNIVVINRPLIKNPESLDPN